MKINLRASKNEGDFDFVTEMKRVYNINEKIDKSVMERKIDINISYKVKEEKTSGNMWNKLFNGGEKEDKKVLGFKGKRNVRNLNHRKVA